jgi:hypothetical protein
MKLIEGPTYRVTYFPVTKGFWNRKYTLLATIPFDCYKLYWKNTSNLDIYISLKNKGDFFCGIKHDSQMWQEPMHGTYWPENTKFYLWADTTSYEDDGTGFLELKTYGINPLT